MIKQLLSFITRCRRMKSLEMILISKFCYNSLFIKEQRRVPEKS